MKTGKKEPRFIKDILLDIAEDPNDDYGKTLRRLPCRVPDSDIGIVVLRYDETIDPSRTIGIVSEFCFIEGAAVADIHGTVVCVRQNV